MSEVGVESAVKSFWQNGKLFIFNFGSLFFNLKNSKPPKDNPSSAQWGGIIKFLNLFFNAVFQITFCATPPE